MEFTKNHSSSLSSLPSELLAIITCHMTLNDIKNLYHCGSSILGLKLAHNGGVRSISISVSSSWNGIPRSILLFRSLTSLTIDQPFRFQDQASDQVLWRMMAFKVSSLPPSLTKLHLHFPTSLISFTNAVLKYSPQTRMNSFRHQLDSIILARLTKGQCKFYPLATILPNLKELYTQSGLFDWTEHRYWPLFVKALPPSLEDLQADCSSLFLSTHHIPWPPNLTRLHILQDHSGHKTININQLPPNLTSFGFKNSSVLQGSWMEATLTSLSLSFLPQSHVPILPPSLTVLHVEQLLDNNNAIFRGGGESSLKHLPRGLTDLTFIRCASWSDLPPLLTRLKLNGLDYRSTALDLSSIRCLPTSLTSLTVIEATVNNVDEILALPPNLTELYFPNTNFEDQWVSYLPKTLRKVSFGSWKLTGAFLNDGILEVTPQVLLDSLDNLPLSSVKKPYPYGLPYTVKSCPASVTRITNVQNWDFPNTSSLPRSLLCIQSIMHIPDTDDCISQLPPRLLRFDSKLRYRLKSWRRFPPTLTRASNASVLVERDDIEEFMRNFSPNSAEPTRILNTLDIPETFKLELWPLAQTPCPVDWMISWDISHFQLLPNSLTALHIGAGQLEHICLQVWESDSPSPDAPSPKITLSPTLRTLKVSGTHECEVLANMMELHPTLEHLEIWPGRAELEDSSLVLLLQKVSKLTSLKVMKASYLSISRSNDWCSLLPDSLQTLDLQGLPVETQQISLLPRNITSLSLVVQSLYHWRIQLAFPPNLTWLHLKSNFTLPTSLAEAFPLSLKSLTPAKPLRGLWEAFQKRIQAQPSSSDPSPQEKLLE